MISNSAQSLDNENYEKNFNIETNNHLSGNKINKNKLSGSNTLMKNSKIPLTKNISKLTQAGNELIVGLNYSRLSDDSELSSSTETLNSSKTSNNLESSENDIKTPTNLDPNNSFIFQHAKKSSSNSLNNSVDDSNSEKNSSSIFYEENHSNVVLTSFVNSKRVEYTSSTSSSDSVLLRENMKKSVPKKFNTESDSDDYEVRNETSNFYVRLPDDIRKSILDDVDNVDRTTVIFKGNPDVPIDNIPVTPLNIRKEIKTTEENIEKSTSPIETVEQENNNINNNNNNINSSKLKGRPLSASSITSTSSSSSAGSENLKEKRNDSYLASVESLADHSEGELVNNLSVSERAALEIIDSEKSYVSDLEQIINGYLKDWRAKENLKPDELNILFSNIEEIFEFNTKLLKKLTESNANPSKIAKCFIELQSEFNVYTVYCTSYPEAISLLTKLLRTSYTNSLLATTQKNLKHNLPLGSYLLKPVQRILKYHLLLDNLRKHVDCEDIIKAHTIMREVAQHIDQVKRNLEQQNRVKELSGILDGWLGPEFTVLGELRQDGLLMENNKPRIVFLFKTMLIITKKKEDDRLQFKTYIQCKDLMLIEHLPGEPSSFFVIPFSEPRNQIKLTARSREEKRRWAHHIKQVMLEDFDIPNRAKELVFKLGDEEDREPDKMVWKWGHSATPDYLERRNQYRRSEFRYRSKKPRKIIQATKSLDSNNVQNHENDEILQRTKSNDNFNSSMTNLNGSCEEKLITPNEKNSISTENLNNAQSRVKSRSKSEPRLPVNFRRTQSMYRENTNNLTNNSNNDDENITNSTKYSTLTPSSNCSIQSSTLNNGKKKENDFEIKMYNNKNLPKRIVNLKKNRAKTLKETSTFYMELKITESTDNLNESEKKVQKENIDECKMENENLKDVIQEKSTKEVEKCDEITNEKIREEIIEKFDENKKDSDIISELLKGNKEFDRILKKPPPKKKSLDNSIKYSSNIIEVPKSCVSESDLTMTSTINKNFEEILVKDAPSVAESIANINATSLDLINKLNELQNEVISTEPIYESLKRNVHVPYKYCPTPTLFRSRSQPYTTQKSIKIKKEDRPDSDYVTLDFNAIIAHNIQTEISQLSNSDSNINYNKVTESKNIISHNENSIKIKYSKEIEVLNRKNSADTISLNSSKLIHERRGSDIVEMSRQSVIYKQGSEDLGSRIAHLDYVDPKTLFTQNQTNILINKNAVKPQRDSVFSSSDSVCDTPKNNYKTLEHNDSFYEDKVEECLENDNFFRDSAIYSDDNDRRTEYNYDENNVKNNIAPQVPRKPNKDKPLPPPLPAKPKYLQNFSNNINNNSNNDNNNINDNNLNNNNCNDSSIKNHLNMYGNFKNREKSKLTTSMSIKDDRKSWVLKQIKNFDKINK